jgi:hypothetical protein
MKRENMCEYALSQRPRSNNKHRFTECIPVFLSNQEPLNVQKSRGEMMAAGALNFM